MNRRYARLDNTLITDNALAPTAKRVALVLALSARKDGTVRVTLKDLAKRSRLCVATVSRGLKELEAMGYLTVSQPYRFSEALGRPVYDCRVYSLIRHDGGYTLVSAKLLGYELTPTAFALALYLAKCAGRTNRAFPSIRHMAGIRKGSCGCGISKASVCRALAALRKCLLVLLLPCLCRHGGASCNTYLLTVSVGGGKPAADQALFQEGWSQNYKTPPNNKITGASIRREREKGVGQFGRFTKIRGWLSALKGRLFPSKFRIPGLTRRE